MRTSISVVLGLFDGYVLDNIRHVPVNYARSVLAGINLPLSHPCSS